MYVLYVYINVLARNPVRIREYIFKICRQYLDIAL